MTSDCKHLSHLLKLKTVSYSTKAYTFKAKQFWLGKQILIYGQFSIFLHKNMLWVYSLELQSACAILMNTHISDLNETSDKIPF